MLKRKISFNNLYFEGNMLFIFCAGFFLKKMQINKKLDEMDLRVNTSESEMD